jgi:hypothetical protein
MGREERNHYLADMTRPRRLWVSLHSTDPTSHHTNCILSSRPTMRAARCRLSIVALPLSGSSRRSTWARLVFISGSRVGKGAQRRAHVLTLGSYSAWASLCSAHSTKLTRRSDIKPIAFSVCGRRCGRRVLGFRRHRLHTGLRRTSAAMRRSL